MTCCCVYPHVVLFVCLSTSCARLLHIIETESSIFGVSWGSTALHCIGVNMDDERLGKT